MGTNLGNEARVNGDIGTMDLGSSSATVKQMLLRLLDMGVF